MALPAKKRAPEIPLVNLFSYIRDLFHTSDPVYRFQEATRHRKIRNQSWWALADWRSLHEADQLEFQWETPDQPILRLHRTELPALPPFPEDLQGWISQEEMPGELPEIKPIAQRKVSFSSQPRRVQAYQAFHQCVHNRPLSEVQDLSIPPILDAWVQLNTDHDRVQLEVQTEGYEAFEEDDLRPELFTAYQRVYREHVSAHTQAWLVNQLFDALHAAHFELKAHAEQRLFLSFGLVSGRLGEEIYQNFLFHIPLRLEISKQELCLYPDTFAQTIRCEQALTDLLPQAFPQESDLQLEQRRQHVLAVVDQFHQEPHEFNLDSGYLRHSYHETACRLLEIFPELEDRFFDEKTLNWAYEDQIPKEGLMLSFSPVVHTRVVESHEHIAKDASHIIEKINELSSTGDSERIPDFFKKLFSLRRPEHKLRIAHKAQDRHFRDLEVSEDALPDRLLFPLPSNREQRAIAERLARQDAVTVMGPPGTGKSHTIANLTSHYVAQGKSVLIVSRYAKALEVIRGKLPGGIRDLAVSFNQQDPQHDALKHAIDAIKDNLSRQIFPEDIQTLEQELDLLETEYRDLLAQLQAWMGSHREALSLPHPEQGGLTLPVATWARDHYDPAYQAQQLLDPLPDAEALEHWLPRLIAWSQNPAQADQDELAFQWPSEAEWPAWGEVQGLLSEQRHLAAQLTRSDYERETAAALRQIIEEQLHRSHEAWQWLATQAPWSLSEDFDPDRLDQLLGQVEHLCAGWETEQQALVPYQIDLSPLSDGDWEDWAEAQAALATKLAGGLNALQRKLLSKAHKALLSCRINGRAVEQPEQLALLGRAIRQQICHNQWHIALQNYLSPLGEQVEAQRVDAWRKKLMQVLRSYRSLQDWEQHLRALGLPVGSLRRGDSEPQWAWLLGIPLYLRLLDSEQCYQQLIAPAQALEGLPASGEALQAALRATDAEAYRDALASYRKDRERMLAAQAWQEETAALEAVLPRTTAHYLHRGEALREEVLRRDHFHARLRTALNERLQQSERLQAALPRLEDLQQQIEAQIADLIALRTWQRKQQEVSDEQRSALSAWRNDLINIGKGYGKNTERNLQSAVTNMQLAKGAVPIWIMQQDTAITFFPEVDPGQFDLLIVDEASQCDISMLNLVFRCKKCIIVGDENQTSVATQASLFPIDRTNQLLDRYLLHHPFKQQFNINNRTASIYTLSGVIYPNIVTLREHFRCRPELIGFSNHYVYDEQIIPLRTATDQRFGAPLEAHHIDDDPADQRRPQLVRQAVQLIADLIEDYEQSHLELLPTVGLLTLDASHEAHREYLIRELSRHPKVKEYSETLNLLVGTSREFQGDERDVMILTSTASHRYLDSGELRPPRAVLGEEMMRIYNVAISRARDKAILLYSAHPESVLKMNEGCYRRRLIEYCQQATEALGAPEATSRSMALDPVSEALLPIVTQTLPEATAQPQFRVGPYRLDLAILHEGRKLGLLIDGQQPLDAAQTQQALETQLTLTRAGWQLQRIPLTDWYADRPGVEARLQAFLVG